MTGLPKILKSLYIKTGTKKFFDLNIPIFATRYYKKHVLYAKFKGPTKYVICASWKLENGTIIQDTKAALHTSDLWLH